MRTFLSNVAVAGGTLTLPQVAAAQNILVDTIIDGVGDCNVTHGARARRSNRGLEYFGSETAGTDGSMGTSPHEPN